MRPIWTGAIGFGLVNIPVKLFSATQSSELDLDMLDKKDLSHIHFARINKKTGREVPWGNIIKGYKLNGQYIALDTEDFEKASAKKTKIIDIEGFVKEEEIDSIYYEIPYYLVPNKTGVKAYNLLREALFKTNKVAISSFVMRNKEHLAILKANKDVIILIQLRFEEEIRNPSALEIPKESVKPSELKMALTLINQLSVTFDISKYRDTYSSQLIKIIRAKAKGIKIKTPQLKIIHGKAKDLMSQLKASLEVKHKKAS